MKRWAGWTAVAAAAFAVFVLVGTAGAADPPTIVIGADGETADVFSYVDAIRERVFIPVPGVDQNGDGQTDQVAIDIMRPAETNSGLKVPAIIDDSPYYTSVGRGNETQYIHSDPAHPGVLDKFPLFYDNYFVPRGYAVILAQAVGTAFSTGCPLHGGPGDVAGFKTVVDWLRGRAPGYTSLADTTPVTADWDNGKNAMIGKSYDGTFANGVASTGVEGLTTIVPISAISDWYDYSRQNGMRLSAAGTHYPASLSSTITQNQSATTLGVVPPNNNTTCLASRNAMSAVDGDADGNTNPFWDARDYNLSVSNVHAAVFESHGINDDNVRPWHMSKWWAGLTANNVPRKLWLSQEGHVDPFEYNRAAWVDTLHQWFDYWLQGVPNGIMDKPQVTIETSANVFQDFASWPLPNTSNVPIFLRGGSSTTVPGSLGLSAGGPLATRLLTDLTNQSDATMVNLPLGSQTNRLVFLSAPLTQDLHISGTPQVDMVASFNRTTANVGALIVDYSPTTSFTKVGRGGSDGVSNTSPAVRTCWGDSTPSNASPTLDSACYIEVTKPLQTINPMTGTGTSGWRVVRGLLDATNRDSYATDTPLVVGQQYDLKFPTLPTDYTFPAGHRIGITLVASYSGFGTTNSGTPTVQATVDTQLSKVTLPVTGGLSAAQASGAFPDITGPRLTLPGTMTQEATSAAGAVVTYTATAADDEDPNPTVTCTPASGSTFPIADTTVNCDAADASGNHTTGSFHVIVQDTTAPAIDPHGDVTAEATSPSGATVSYDSPATHDAVDGDGTASCTPASGTQFAKGQTTITCTALDHHGNSTSSNFKVFVVDTTAPTTTAAVSPASPDGLHGWYITNPLITLTATDTASQVTKTQYYIGPDPSWVDYSGPVNLCSAAVPCGMHWFHWASTDAAGNTEATKSITLSVDLANPTSSASVSPAAQNGWYASPTVTLTGQDGNGSGIDHISYRIDGEPTWHTYSGPLSGFSTGNHFVQFQATDVSGRIESQVNLVAFKADAVKPAITITKPVDGSQVPQDKALDAAFKCTDRESGLATCVGTVANGSPVDTSTVGDHAFTVTATDAAGNQTVKTVHYLVTYTWNGFFSPITNTETMDLNLVHAGDLIRLGFSLNGDRGLTPFAAGFPTSEPIACPGWTPHSVPAAGPGATTGLSFGNASGHYTYGWQTQTGWANTCRRFELKLNDGTTTVHSADFMFFS